jgi:hypothetical protein
LRFLLNARLARARTRVSNRQEPRWRAIPWPLFLLAELFSL